MSSQNKFIAKGISLIFFWLIVIATLATLFSCSDIVYDDGNLMVVSKMKETYYGGYNYKYQVRNKRGSYFWIRTNKKYEYGDLIQILKKDEKNSN